MGRSFRSLFVLTAAVALAALLAYSRPLFGQAAVPEAPSPPKAETVPSKAMPDLEEAAKKFSARDWDGALTLLEAACKKNTDLPPPRVLMFDWFRQSQQGFMARMALERAVMSDPKDPEAYVIFGNIALQERRITDAQLLFLKAKELIGPFDKSLKRKNILEPQTISGLANVEEAREQWPEAQAQLETLLKLNPKDAMAMQRLARALFQQKEATAALKMLRASKEADKQNMLTPEAALGRFYEQYGDHKNAVTWMTHALAKAPEDLATQLVVAQWNLETAQLDEAEKHSAKALKLADDARRTATEAEMPQVEQRLLSAKVLRGLVALFRKEYKNAEKYFEDAHLQSPGNFAAKNNLALALCEEKIEGGGPDMAKVNKALEYATDSYQQNSRNSETASTLGWVLYKAGRRQQAEGALRQAAQAGNLTPDTAYFLAQVSYDGGNKDLAKNLLEASLKTVSFSMRPEAQALLDKIKAEPPPKDKDNKK
jgi:tetratricopeptide (TPR) repeat protein